MTCTVASPSETLKFGRFDQSGTAADTSLFSQPPAYFTIRSSRIEAAALHFGCVERLTSLGSTRVYSSSSSLSFSGDIVHKQVSEYNGSLNTPVLSRLRGIVLFLWASWNGGVSFRCCARSSKVSIVDQAAISITKSITNDGEALLIKEPAIRSSASVKQVTGRKVVKRKLTSKATRTETLKLSFKEIEETRAKLENLGVQEPELFKYLNEVAPAGVPIDDIVSCVSSLMGVVRVTWDEAIGMLSKYPSTLKLEVSQIEKTVAFLTNLGMGKQEVSRVLVNHPPLLAYNVEEMKSIIEYLVSLGLTKEDVHTVLHERPQTFNASAQDVMFTVNCLLQAEIPVSDLTRILSRSPDLFSSKSRDHLRSCLNFFKQMGLYGGALGKGIARRPNLLHFDLEAMKQAHDFLAEYLSPNDLAKLVCRFAEVLAIDPKRKMEPMVNHLLQLGVKPTSLGTVLLRRPQLLGYTILGLEPTVQYLKELGVTDRMLGRLISISPQVLTLNCEEKLKPAVEYLRSVGVVEKDLERLLVRNAQLLCCSIEKNLTPKFNFFLDMGLAREDVIRILVLFPSMFGQSIEACLEPKYRYLIDVMKRSPTEIIEFPQYFGYSLEKRIKPRYEQLEARGITHLSLPSMLACIEDDFISRYMTGDPPTRGPYNTKKAPQRCKYTD